MITIYDYSGTPTTIDVDLEDENIVLAKINVVTGDEILEITTKDGKKQWYDSSETRCTDYFDDAYYIKKYSKIMITKAWEQSSNSYDRADLIHAIEDWISENGQKENNTYKSFKIFFSDLNVDAQKRLLEFVGEKDPSDMNWDMDICPIAIFDVEDEEVRDEQNTSL